MRPLANKRILVTGAAQGIGREIALACARRRAQLVLVDKNEKMLPAAAAQVEQVGGSATTYPLDLTDDTAIVELARRVEKEGGPIDVLVNNAGVVFGGAFTEVPWAQHALTFQVNSLAVAAMTHAFLPQLIARPEAHLVTIASAAGFVGLPFGTTYAASKWAALGFSESIRAELGALGHRHVGVTTVCPSYVSTGMFNGAIPPRTTKMLEPTRLAALVVRAIERRSAFVMTPWLVRITPILAALLPTPVQQWVAQSLGANDTMKNWRGHTPIEASTGTPKVIETESARSASAETVRVSQPTERHPRQPQ